MKNAKPVLENEIDLKDSNREKEFVKFAEQLPHFA